MKLWSIEADELNHSKCGGYNWETSVFYVLADSYIIIIKREEITICNYI